jgi:hypothetical protein
MNSRILSVAMVLALTASSAAAATGNPADNRDMSKAEDKTTAGQTSMADTSRVAERQAWWTAVARHDINPAFMLDRYRKTMSELSVYADYSGANEAVLMSLGKGRSLYGAGVNSFVRLSPTMTVWGSASYQTGRKRGIKWNSTADYILLYPYVMADTLGGDLHHERYTFSGGYAQQFGRWRLGLTADFRAEHEYRTYDPRPRSVVTNLSLRAGASYIWRDYEMGAGAGARFYKQTNEVAFYREAGVIPEYQMTGLGSDYVRFSGSNRSAYYTSTGFLADLGVQPLASGAYLSARYSYAPFERVLPELNALPLSKLYLLQSEMEAGWKHQGAVDWAARLVWDYENRKGDEHVAGNASSSQYLILADLTMFRSHTASYGAGLTLHLATLRDLTVALDGGYINSRASYVEPERRVSMKRPFVRGGVQTSLPVGQSSTFTITADGSWLGRCSNPQIVMPYAMMDAARTAYVNTTYDRLTAGYGSAALTLRWQLSSQAWGGYSAFIEVRSQYTGGSDYNAKALKAVIGFVF